jgi:hypothetical protein
MNLNEKFEAAKRAHEVAMSNLEVARLAYNEVEPSYAEITKKIDELHQSKREQVDVMAAAKERLAAAMLTTMGRQSKEVKEALAARRTAEDLVDQFNELEAIVSEGLPASTIKMSEAARKYLSAYDGAVATWAEMNALGVLVECGDRIAQAMSVRMRGIKDYFAEDYEDRNHKRCSSFVLEELRRLCDNYKSGPTPYADLIAKPKLGAFSEAEILSPATASMMEKKQARAAIQAAK